MDWLDQRAELGEVTVSQTWFLHFGTNIVSYRNGLCIFATGDERNPSEPNPISLPNVSNQMQNPFGYIVKDTPPTHVLDGSLGYGIFLQGSTIKWGAGSTQALPAVGAASTSPIRIGDNSSSYLSKVQSREKKTIPQYGMLFAGPMASRFSRNTIECRSHNHVPSMSRRLEWCNLMRAVSSYTVVRFG
jgi:hypothetical protein